MRTKWMNLTPHEVTILGGAAPVIIPASGRVARVSQTLTEVGTVAGVRVVTSTYGQVEGLPAADPVCPYCGMADCDGVNNGGICCQTSAGGDDSEPTRYIVSAMVRAAVPGRRDVYSPADFVRDAGGRITGCKALEANL